MNKNLFFSCLGNYSVSSKHGLSATIDWITTIHIRSLVVGSIYGLRLANYVKTLLLMGFELFWQQVGYVKSQMVYDSCDSLW